MEDVFLAAIIFGSIVWIIDRTVDRRSLNKERMRLIDKEGDLTTLKSPEKTKYEWGKGSSLKYGLVLIGAGGGILLGGFFENNTSFFGHSQSSGIGYFFGVFLCVGIGLIIDHLLKKSGKSN